MTVIYFIITNAKCLFSEKKESTKFREKPTTKEEPTLEVTSAPVEA